MSAVASSIDSIVSYPPISYARNHSPPRSSRELVDLRVKSVDDAPECCVRLDRTDTVDGVLTRGAELELLANAGCDARLAKGVHAFLDRDGILHGLEAHDTLEQILDDRKTARNAVDFDTLGVV